MADDQLKGRAPRRNVFQSLVGKATLGITAVAATSPFVSVEPTASSHEHGARSRAAHSLQDSREHEEKRAQQIEKREEITHGLHHSLEQQRERQESMERVSHGEKHREQEKPRPEKKPETVAERKRRQPSRSR